jgi:general secretion pathway protein G
MKRHGMRRRRGGFTLMEVLLVLVIICILGSLAVGMFSNTQKLALQRQAKGQIGLFKTPIDTYNMDLNGYPPDLEALRTPPSGLANEHKWNGPYIEELPDDPWGRPYQFVYPGKMRPDSYDLFSLGEDGQEGTDDDIGNWQVN